MTQPSFEGAQVLPSGILKLPTEMIGAIFDQVSSLVHPRKILSH